MRKLFNTQSVNQIEFIYFVEGAGAIRGPYKNKPNKRIVGNGKIVKCKIEKLDE